MRPRFMIRSLFRLRIRLVHSTAALVLILIPVGVNKDFKNTTCQNANDIETAFGSHRGGHFVLSHGSDEGDTP